MNGLKYLKGEWIENLWKKLHEVFKEQIRHYQGSVAEYFASLNPFVHTMGRVFFHLVESRKDDYPFAFMATYMIGMDYLRASGAVIDIDNMTLTRYW